MTTENSFQQYKDENNDLVLKSKKGIKKIIIVYVILAIIGLFLLQLKWIAFLTCSLQVAFALYYYSKAAGFITIDYNVKQSKPSLFFPLLIPIIVLFEYP